MIQGKECGFIVIDELNQPWTEETYNKLADITEYINSAEDFTVRTTRKLEMFSLLYGSDLYTFRNTVIDIEPIVELPKPQKWRGVITKGSEAKNARRAQLKRGKR